MTKFLKYFLAILIFCTNISAKDTNSNLPHTYLHIIEKLIFFKHDKFTAFYGGPIDKTNKGVKWVMPVLFKDKAQKTRAVYEVAFVNCDLHNATDAEIIFVKVSDINIKFQNTLFQDYTVFSSLIDGKYKNDKYIIIRNSDVANVFYPDIFISSMYGYTIESDKKVIANFLHEQFQTKNTCKSFYVGETQGKIDFENEHEIIYHPIKVCLKLDNKLHSFYVEKRIKKNDMWQIYYVIFKSDKNLDFKHFHGHTFLRLDSGCISGQIYDDESCDCLDQLHNSLKQLTQDHHSHGIVIHVPAHDGRGFGTAPKAETEIYKRGGTGRIHSTEPLNTILAAKTLYGIDEYDLRSFNGAAEILKDMGIKKVILFTDNIRKVSALERHGIKVIRKKTDTHKASCLNHLKAKKNDSMYFSE